MDRFGDLRIPVTDLGTVGVAVASDWIVVLGADELPAAIHLPSGAWRRDKGGPLAGVQAPATVWTGDRLIVWGGVSSPSDTGPSAATGAMWTPPGS